MKRLVCLWILAATAFGQTNRVANFSFETAGASASVAANWSGQWNGYTRASVNSGGWDGVFALQLIGSSSNLAGAVQKINLNQGTAVPVLITMRVKGQDIQNLPADKYGAAIYCRVRRVDGSTDYCPSTTKTKNIGTFHWRYIGVNTATLPFGHVAIEWIEVIPILGAISGTAWFDDVHVAEYAPGLFRGAVTLMFDDGFKEQYTLALPAVRSYGWKGVEAAVVNYLSSGDPNYMTLTELKSMAEEGWEVVSHSIDHSDLSLLSQSAMENQLYWSRKYFFDNGMPVKSFALPFGGYDATVLGLNSERAYFSSMRKVERGFNPVGSFPYDIKIQEMKSSTTLTNVNSWLNNARSRKMWLVILIHKIRDVCPDSFCASTSTFNNTLTAVQSSTLPVVTYEQGLTLVKSPR